MPTCAEVFSEGHTGPGLQIRVAQVCPEFICESKVCSAYSPGPVEDDETLGFLLINPLHYDEERKTVLPDAFQELFQRDLSVLRVQHSTQDDLTETRGRLVARGAAKIPPALRTVEEVCVASAGVLRAEQKEGVRILAVYDTAIEECLAHASIFTIPAALQGRAFRKKVRESIHRLMTQTVISYKDFSETLKQAA